MEKRLDAAGLTAITTLMNKSKVNMTLDLKKAENEIMGISTSRKKEINVIEEYDKKINSFAQSIGINIGKSGVDVMSLSGSDDDSDAESSDGSQSTNSEVSSNSGYSSRTGRSSKSSESDRSSQSSRSSRSSRSSQSSGSTYSNSSSAVSSDMRRMTYITSKKYNHSGHRDSHRDRDGHRDRGSHRDRDRPQSEYVNPINARFDQMHQEQPIAASTDRIKQMELKSVKIEKIQQLYGILTDAGIDCSKLVIPTADSSMQEIDLTLSSLQLKNDRNRYSTMAEEVLLTAAASVERLLDGTREIPLLGIRPDYTNYSATLNVKLHSLRYHTAQAVGEMIERHNFGHKTRIMMELLPGFFLYPIQQAKNSRDPGLTAEHLGAINNIRKATTPLTPNLKDLTDI
jgi:hypothetical protein